MNTIPDELLNVAITAAQTAGTATLKYFRSPSLIVEEKTDHSPVTAADKESEGIIRTIIRSHFPEHGIVGEEFGETPGTSNIRWIIDPLDGTKSFVRNSPFYGVLIGIERDGVIDAGVAHMPALKETYTARKGKGSHCGGLPIRVSQVSRLQEASFIITSSSDALIDPDKRGGYLAIQKRAHRHRGIGDCYGHLLVASGRAEIMLDARMRPWDCAALKIIVEEAGGSFTDWHGNDTIDGGSAVSVNAELREEAFSFLRVHETVL